MLLVRLKYWRTLRGYSVRELAALSGIDASSISLLENQKRTPHGKTARDLAAALEVEVADLYEVSTIPEFNQPGPTNQTGINANKIQTKIKSTRSLSEKKATGNFWVVIEDDNEDPFGPYVQKEAERLKQRLGRARVYEAINKFEVWEKHRQFMIAVTRGHDAW